jgi:hypothetical protein
MKTSARLIVTALAIAAASVACNQPPAVNPWIDDVISEEAHTTPSRNGFLAAGREPVVRKRAVPESELGLANGAVPHYPLWWEDPFMDKGDMDGRFAWTWQDYLHMPYGLGRFILNTCAVPVSVVVHPPGMPMVSDGVVGKNHDAKPGNAPNPTATPADFGYAAQTQPAAGT